MIRFNFSLTASDKTYDKHCYMSLTKQYSIYCYISLCEFETCRHSSQSTRGAPEICLLPYSSAILKLYHAVVYTKFMGRMQLKWEHISIIYGLKNSENETNTVKIRWSGGYPSFLEKETLDHATKNSPNSTLPELAEIFNV